MVTKRQTRSTDAAPAAQITHQTLYDEIDKSYLVYAMSTITSRAIPDVRDGLKPVHRRILYDMWRTHLTPDKDHVKSAKVVGSVIGSLHPHGDTGVYEALVRLTQSFSLNLPLIDGHGNFGTLDDDAAQYRYTECKLTKAAMDLLGEIGEDATDFVPNFDNTQQEPLYLPGVLPNLLINGVIGIAVGMNTIIPPHNVKETIKAAQLLLNDPECSDTAFYKILPGPDFPTGGIITTPRADIRHIMQQGNGHITLEAKMTIQQTTKARQDIIITQLPYAKGPEKIVSKINKLIKDGAIDNISRVQDLSDQYIGLQIIVECKPHCDAQQVIDYLLKSTDLRTTIGINQIAIVGGKPQVLSTKAILDYYLQTRLDSIKKYAAHRLQNAQKRLHLLEGLALVLADVAALIHILENSQQVSDAKNALIATFHIDEEQALYILDMPIRRLVHLEREQLYAQIKELQAQVKRYTALVRNKTARRTELNAQLDTLITKYGAPRHTQIKAA